MEDRIELVEKIVISAASTMATVIFGGWDLAIQLLLACMVIDWITGMVRSGMQGKLNSSHGLKGIIKKIGMLLLVTLAVIMDSLTLGNGLVRLFTIYYFAANEGLSIIENLGECGVPIPCKLKNAILNLKKETEEDDHHGKA